MACSTNCKRIVSIQHGGSDVVLDCVGGNIQEDITWGETTPGIRKAAAVWLDKYTADAEGKGQGFVTPIVRGTNATLKFTLENIAGAVNKYVQITKMLAGAVGFDFNSAPYTQGQKFKYDSADADDLAPISVSV